MENHLFIGKVGVVDDIARRPVLEDAAQMAPARFGGAGQQRRPHRPQRPMLQVTDRGCVCVRYDEISLTAGRGPIQRKRDPTRYPCTDGGSVGEEGGGTFSTRWAERNLTKKKSN